jgi:ASC-1-like (ASCH) protein
MNTLFIILLLIICLILTTKIIISVHRTQNHSTSGGIEKSMNIKNKKIIVSPTEYNHITQGLKNICLLSDKKFKLDDQIIIKNKVTGESITAFIVDIYLYNCLEDCLLKEGYKNIFPNVSSFSDAISIGPKNDKITAIKIAVQF